MATLTGKQIAGEGLHGWSFLLGGLQTRIHTGTFATGLAVVNAIGAAVEETHHHPELTLRHDHVDVRLTGQHGVTDRDVQLARTITSIAAGLRLAAAGLSRMELALDTPAHESVLPFWAAVFAVPATAADDEVRDPAGSWPTLWFQESGSAEPRQRWHPDVWMAPEEVQPRIDAALAAGGTLVSDADAPSYWVLADPDGNRVCLCTWQARD